MSVEENKAIVKKWFDEAINNQNESVVDEIWAEKIIVHSKNEETSEQTPADRKAYLKGMANFVDVKVTYDDPMPIGEEDLVAFRWIATGKAADSGESFTYTHNYIYRISGGKIAEEWQCFF